MRELVCLGCWRDAGSGLELSEETGECVCGGTTAALSSEDFTNMGLAFDGEGSSDVSDVPLGALVAYAGDYGSVPDLFFEARGGAVFASSEEVVRNEENI